ncbi:MAG: MBOAT family O-acyltransferase [Bacteroidales bacterium]|nr:MBOAT family O-acyltransferase [Bacteroidales bacterium]
MSDSTMSDLTENLINLLSYDATQPLLFNSGLFLFLFVGFSIFYAFLSGRRTVAVRLLYVTAFSYYFYYKNAGAYCALLALITLVNYFTALRMANCKTQGGRRFCLFLAVAFMLLQLGYFKYTNFISTSIVPLFGGESRVFDIFVPLGISFFTFQSLSYIVDVYRRQMAPTRSILDLAFFVSFFPTLLSGPILRARTFLPQLRQPLQVTREMFGTGLWFIMMGLFKKAVISDYIGENFVNRIFDNPSLYTGMENLFAVYGYALKLYCDFSGYSDMAIGIALWMGFQIPANFRAPYKSDSITDFWRRWHISLSTWLRDYLYISMGGNRCGRWRMYFNQFMTMLLGGLWHGASWNFIVWGCLHGAALCGHKAWRERLGHDKHYHSTGWRRIAAIVLTFHLVCLCWLFFANATFEASGVMLSKIFTDFHGDLLPQFLAGYPAVMALIVGGFVLHYLPTSWNDGTCRLLVRLPLIAQLVIFLALIILVVQVRGSEVQPFIYLQF